MEFFIQFLIALAIAVVSYMMTPKPKQPNTPTRDIEYPTAEAGRPITRITGEITIKSPNILYYGEKDISEGKVKI